MAINDNHAIEQMSMQASLNDSDISLQDARNRFQPLLITTGEPAGIGMDILLQLAKEQRLTQLNIPVIVLADAVALAQRYQQMYEEDSNPTDIINSLSDKSSNDRVSDNTLKGVGLEQDTSTLWQVLTTADQMLNTSSKATEGAFNEHALASMISRNVQFHVIDVPCNELVIAGELNANNASMVMTQLQLAHQLAYSNQVAAIITGPLHKSVLIDANLTLADGSMFTGHTEYFMQQSGRDKVVMMLANTAMRVALVTTHLPLREVAEAITPLNVRQTVQILLEDLTQKFGLNHPKVLVCGLNPHAGEDGHLGMEEIEIINPVLHEFQARGVDISLAMPADTLFTPGHLANCDAVIAMYHDQGLPVLKSHGFGDTVNLTLGLPYIRTSVDHGTALNLAGQKISKNQKGQASASSLWQALTMAKNMADGRDKRHQDNQSF